jgi:signal transduction histidine kinase
MKFSFTNLPLLWRVLLSTSAAITVLLALTGWALQTYAVRASEQSLEEEVRTNLQASEALWAMRAHTLSSMSRMISSMSDVRAAFMTRDEATIHDTAQELWSRVSEEDALFIVLDPGGKVIASLGGNYTDSLVSSLSLQKAMQRFPTQVSGFAKQGQRMFYVILTPVYIQSGNGQALFNVLLAGFEVNAKFAGALKNLTRGGDFAFLSGDNVIASTLKLDSASHVRYPTDAPNSLQRIQLNGQDYLVLGSALKDIDGIPIGELLVLRSFAGARHALDELQRNVALIWLCAVLAGLALTSMMARRIVEPVKQLDRAASEVARHNYDYRVPVGSTDELGRLALTFNDMCDSIRNAREELIRQERITTIGRLSSSIVHDLRNPLAAIYGGAEMLVDSELSREQSKRLASSIYRASRRIQELLQDLVNVSRGKGESAEVCRLGDVIESAREEVKNSAELVGVRLHSEVLESIELRLERTRMQRVFVNLMNNAIEAMPEGGEIRISAQPGREDVLVDIDDTGTGIAPEIRSILFQPFASIGKRNGLGLGLALSRQTLLDHGGDLWAEEKPGPGARFRMRIPLRAHEESGTAALHNSVTR